MTNDQKKIQELSFLNEEFENYFNNSIIPQLLFNRDLILLKFTPPAMKQFKLTTSDVGLSIHELDSKIRHSSIVKNINFVIENNEILEKEIQTEDFHWYQMNVIPNLKKKDPKPNGAIVTFIDITNRIKDLKEQESIIAEYETLLETVSHDIRNQMTGMHLSVQMLLDSDLEDKTEVQYYSGVIENGIKAIKSVLSDIFTPSSYKFKFKSVEELINIENILEDVKLALINEISLARVKISCEFNTSEISFPRREFRTIIYNFINNAIKFKSPDKDPKIHISSVKEDKYTILSVKDNGIGIDPSQHKNIFKKFSRVNESVEGTGIGLFLIKKLILNRGGKIKVKSTLGEGAEFLIYIKS